MIHRPGLWMLTALTACFAVPVTAGDIRPIPPEKFSELHRMIRVQPGEQRFWEIPWKLTVGEARRQAAREGKPIFVWAGAGGAPIGVC